MFSHATVDYLALNHSIWCSQTPCFYSVFIGNVAHYLNNVVCQFISTRCASQSWEVSVTKVKEGLWFATLKMTNFITCYHRSSMIFKRSLVMLTFPLALPNDWILAASWFVRCPCSGFGIHRLEEIPFARLVTMAEAVVRGTPAHAPRLRRSWRSQKRLDHWGPVQQSKPGPC